MFWGGRSFVQNLIFIYFKNENNVIKIDKKYSELEGTICYLLLFRLSQKS